MEKGLRMGLGQTPCQAYWHDLLDMIEVSDGNKGPRMHACNNS